MSILVEQFENHLLDGLLCFCIIPLKNSFRGVHFRILRLCLLILGKARRQDFLMLQYTRSVIICTLVSSFDIQIWGVGEFISVAVCIQLVQNVYLWLCLITTIVLQTLWWPNHYQEVASSNLGNSSLEMCILIFILFTVFAEGFVLLQTLD